MVKREINILAGGKVSKRSQKLLRDTLGLNVLQIVDAAREQGVDLGVRSTTKRRRAYSYFAGIYNERVREENAEEAARLAAIRAAEKEQRRLERQRRRADRVYRWENLNESIVERGVYRTKFRSKRSKNQPLTIRLRSRMTDRDIMREFTFNNYFHFQKWLKSVADDTVIVSDSENSKRLVAVGNRYKDIFAFFSIDIGFTEGGHKGCWSPNKKKDVVRTMKLVDYVVTAMDKKEVNDGDNNCGFRALECLTRKKIDIQKWRRQFQGGTKCQLKPKQLDVVHRTLSKKPLIFIDEYYTGDFDKANDYIIVKDNHYVAVTSWEERDYQAYGNKGGRKHGKLAFDIETRQTEEVVMIGDSESKVLKSAILSIVYQAYRCKKMKKTFVTDAEKNCCEKYLDWLSEEASQGRYYNGVAHNGSRFDFFLLMSYFSQSDIEQSECRIRGTSIIGFEYKGHAFRDSCCFLTDSLKNLCDGYLTTPEEKQYAKITDVMIGGKKISNTQLCFYKPKLKFWDFIELEHREPEFWREYVKYCEYDCESLFLVWEKFREQIEKIIVEMGRRKGCGKKLIAKVGFNKVNTIGSLAKKLITLMNNDRSLNHTDKYKKMLNLFIDDDVEKYNFLCQFKRGGISHANQLGWHREGVCGYDIKSQYPAAMVQMMIPVGKSEWVTEYIPNGKGFYKLVNMVWKDGWGGKFKPIARSESGKSLDWKYPVEENFCDNYMIEYLVEHCGLLSFEVEIGLISFCEIQGNKLFDNYVKTLYDLKAQEDHYKATGDSRYNAAFRAACKLLANSLSGKLVEEPSKYFSLKFNEDGKDSLNGVNFNKDVQTVAIWEATKERKAIEKKYKQKTNYGCGYKYKTKTAKNEMLEEIRNANLENNGMEKVGERKVFNEWVIAGIMVYSFSKRLLWDYVLCLPNGADDVILVETDGLYFGLPHKETFIKNVEALNHPVIRIGEDLGNVENELSEEKEGFVLGKKDYLFGDIKYLEDGYIDWEPNKTKLRCKGMRKHTTTDDGTKIDILDKPFFTRRYNGETISKTWKAIDKTLYGSSKKASLSLAGYNMTRQIKPHNIKSYRVYEKDGSKVKMMPYRKYGTL
mgnify:CR=1 FL=1